MAMDMEAMKNELCMAVLLKYREAQDILMDARRMAESMGIETGALEAAERDCKAVLEIMNKKVDE